MKAKKPPKPSEIAHAKFLAKMGVTKEQLKQRKVARKREQIAPQVWRPVDLG
jgi:hypothetical protein